jgi:hypothetical protein
MVRLNSLRLQSQAGMRVMSACLDAVMLPFIYDARRKNVLLVGGLSVLDA